MSDQERELEETREALAVAHRERDGWKALCRRTERVLTDAQACMDAFAQQRDDERAKNLVVARERDEWFARAVEAERTVPPHIWGWLHDCIECGETLKERNRAEVLRWLAERCEPAYPLVGQDEGWLAKWNATAEAELPLRIAEWLESQAASCDLAADSYDDEGAHIGLSFQARAAGDRYRWVATDIRQSHDLLAARSPSRTERGEG